jgi:phosphoglycolate phosphatase-like HAD superfamily hydrolase
MSHAPERVVWSAAFLVSAGLPAFSRRTLLAALVAAGLCGSSARAQIPDPLASWNEGAAKAAITDFVARVTTPGGPDFVPVEARIATFDNDGTLWTEQPIYFQVAFAIDQVKARAAQHPEWKQRQPFKAVLENDRKALALAGEKGLLQIMAATHAGMTTAEFAKIVSEWIATARHPRFNRPYIDLVYQPMIELLAYMRVNGFKTFIVSGGGIEFMRPWTEKVYGIPPEQVVGSSGVTRFKLLPDGTPVLLKEPKVEFIDDGPGRQSASTGSSAAARSSPSATRTATSRCWNGPQPEPARASWRSSTTPMPSANGPMTASLRSASSTRPGTRR